MARATAIRPILAPCFFGAEAALEQLKSILKPGGKLIGEAGSKESIRVLPFSQREALTTELSKVGDVFNKPTYNGTFREITGLEVSDFARVKNMDPLSTLIFENYARLGKFLLSRWGNG